MFWNWLFKWKCNIFASAKSSPIGNKFPNLVTLINKQISPSFIKPGKPYWTGRLSTVHLLLLISLAQHIYILKILFTFCYKP